MIRKQKTCKPVTANDKGGIADYRYDNGILYSYSKSPKRTIKNITDNIALVKQITGNKRVPLLIYLCNSPVPDKATRKFSTEQLLNVYTRDGHGLQDRARAADHGHFIQAEATADSYEIVH